MISSSQEPRHWREVAHSTLGADALQLETALDRILAELGCVYSAISMQIGRTETSNSETQAGNKILLKLIKQAEDASQALKIKVENIHEHENPASLCEAHDLQCDPSGESMHDNSIPSIAHIDSVLAQARAIRNNSHVKLDDKPGAHGQPRSGHTRLARHGNLQRGEAIGKATSNIGTASRHNKAFGSGPTTARNRNSSQRKTPAASKVSKSPGSISMRHECSPTEKQATGGLKSDLQSHGPPQAPAALMPSVPRLPLRIAASLKRLEAAQQERRDASTSSLPVDGGQFWIAQIQESGHGFLDDLKQDQTLCCSDVQGPHKNEWLNFQLQRCVELLAVDMAQTYVSRAVDRTVQFLLDEVSCEPKHFHLEQFILDIQYLYNEIQEALNRAVTEGGFPSVAKADMWRNNATQAVIRHTDLHLRNFQEASADRVNSIATVPVDAWLPGDQWSALPATPTIMQIENTTQQSKGSHGQQHWMEALLPGYTYNSLTHSQGGVACETLRQLEGILRARHQLQLCVLQMHLESGSALSLLPPAEVEIENSNMRELLAARVRLADGFLTRGLDRGLCTLSDKIDVDIAEEPCEQTG